MIKDLTVKNYQSHKDSRVVFDPGVNVLVGPSDSGKTALLRAIQWLVFNKPGGESFRSWWGGKTEVSLTCDDGEVTRLRDKAFNGYLFNGEQYVGLGLGKVPEPIIDFLNLSPMNIQNQLDSHFMLSWSPGERGGYINDIANLKIIDETIANIKKTKREEERELASITKQIGEAEIEVQSYEYLESMEVDVAEVEEIAARAIVLADKREGLGSIIAEIEALMPELDDIAKIIKLEGPVEQAYKVLVKARQVEDQGHELANMVREHINILKRIDKAEAAAMGYEKELEEATPEVCPTCGKTGVCPHCGKDV